MSEKKTSHVYDRHTGMSVIELVKIGMRFWEDNEAKMYIEWVVHNRGKKYFLAGVLTGAILSLFVLCLIAILRQR